MSAEDVARVHVERLDVQPGDVVLVIFPDEWDHERTSNVMDSFEWLGTEHQAVAFGVPDSLTFKVVRATA